MPARLVRAWNQAYEGHKLVGLSILAAISVALIAAGVLAATAVFSHNQRDNCQMATAVRDGVVVLLRDAEHLVENPPKGLRRQSPEERDLTIKFYNRNIRHLQSVSCSNR